MQHYYITKFNEIDQTIAARYYITKFNETDKTMKHVLILRSLTS